MRQIGLHHAVIAAVAGLVLFVNLGGSRLWDRDEPRNAGCAAEMLARGDWVVPVFNAELRAHKPVLLYWLIMSAYSVFGVTEFAARFWSAMLGVGTALATYQLGRRLFSPAVGLWAGVIVATSLMFDVAGRAATPDSALIFFSTAALAVFVLTGLDPQQGYFPASRAAVFGIYGLMGMAVLAKGPVGVVLPTAVIGMSLLILRLPESASAEPRSRQARWLAWLRPFGPRHFLDTCRAMQPLIAIAAVSLVAVPWYVWVGMRTGGEFLRVFFLDHHLSRATSPMEGHHGSVLFYAGAILVGFFPWSVFAIPAAVEWRASLKRRTERTGAVFAACWAGVFIGIFSLAQTKLPSYVTPCYPALAILTAVCLDRWVRGEMAVRRAWMAVAFGLLGAVGLVLLVALPVASAWFLPGEAWLGLLGLPLLAGAIACLVLLARHRRPAAALTLAGTAISFVALLFGWALPRVDRHQQNQRLLAAIDQLGQQPRVGAFGALEPTWIFYGGRPIDELTTGADPRNAARGGRWTPKPWPEAAQFYGDGHDRFIITTDRHWPALRERLPAGAAVLAQCPRFLRSGNLLLIGREPAVARGDAPDSRHRLRR
jgi:4-amino-4-deoxy-L-arabinose transferase-like glycosyltransferase